MIERYMPRTAQLLFQKVSALTLRLRRWLFGRAEEVIYQGGACPYFVFLYFDAVVVRWVGIVIKQTVCPEFVFIV